MAFRECIVSFCPSVSPFRPFPRCDRFVSCKHNRTVQGNSSVCISRHRHRLASHYLRTSVGQSVLKPLLILIMALLGAPDITRLSFQDIYAYLITHNLIIQSIPFVSLNYEVFNLVNVLIIIMNRLRAIL